MCSLSRQGDVYVLTFTGDGEHRFNPDSMAAIHRALDEVERSEGSVALVTTSEGKFFSNGLDLMWLSKNKTEEGVLMQKFHELLARVLAFPVPTVAAICGHAAAGGCMLGLAHDYQVMRADKGFIFLNEVDIGLPLTPGMNALIRAKLPLRTYHEAVLAGKRYGGSEAQKAGVISLAQPDASSTLQAAMELAASLAKRKWKRPVYQALKKEMFAADIHLLEKGGLGFGETVGALATASRM